MRIIKVDCVRHADSFLKRFRGYMFQKKPSNREVMIFNHCNSIHTFNMKFKLDLLFLDDNNKVIKRELSIPHGRVIPSVKGATKVVEAAEGLFRNVDEGETISFDTL